MPTLPTSPDKLKHIAPLHGGDRSGLGAEGWAEVSDDLIGGHPELEDAPLSRPEGALNGPQPRTDPATGAARENDAQ